jgi:hypothetical protein
MRAAADEIDVADVEEAVAMVDAEAIVGGEGAAALDAPAAAVVLGCGACFQRMESSVHQCMMVRADEEHVRPLHSKIVCNHVVMPIEGFYFCNMACLHAYNEWLRYNGAVSVMPDDGTPVGSSQNEYVLPARRSPQGALETPPLVEELMPTAAEEAMDAAGVAAMAPMRAEEEDEEEEEAAEAAAAQEEEEEEEEEEAEEEEEEEEEQEEEEEEEEEELPTKAKANAR